MNAKDALDLTGRIADLIKKGANLEAQEKIVELRGMVVDLSAENVSLRDELLRIREKSRQRENLRYNETDEAYYFEGGDDPGPYCQPCWAKDERLSRLAKADSYAGKWHCHVCKGNFGPQKPMPPIDHSSFV